MSAPTRWPKPTPILSVYALDTGGCGACGQSVAALAAPRYAPDLLAHGISFTRSPRHADIILIAGPMTNASRDAVRRVVEAVPEPRALVAVGDCAIDGGAFRGSPYLSNPPAEELDVNVEIAGSPPAPSAILAAIVEAAQLLYGGERAVDASDAAADIVEDDEQEIETISDDAAAEQKGPGA